MVCKTSARVVVATNVPQHCLLTAVSYQISICVMAADICAYHRSTDSEVPYLVAGGGRFRWTLVYGNHPLLPDLPTSTVICCLQPETLCVWGLSLHTFLCHQQEAATIAQKQGANSKQANWRVNAPQIRDQTRE